MAPRALFVLAAASAAVAAASGAIVRTYGDATCCPTGDANKHESCKGANGFNKNFKEYPCCDVKATCTGKADDGGYYCEPAKVEHKDECYGRDHKKPVDKTERKHGQGYEHTETRRSKHKHGHRNDEGPKPESFGYQKPVETEGPTPSSSGDQQGPTVDSSGDQQGSTPASSGDQQPVETGAPKNAY
jgi:hypothetical protein